MSCAKTKLISSLDQKGKGGKEYGGKWGCLISGFQHFKKIPF